MLCNPKDPKMLHELDFHAPLIHVLLAVNKLRPISHLMVQAKFYLFINFHPSLFEKFHNMRNIMRSWDIISFICPIKELMCSGSRHENLESCESHLDYINTSLLTLDETKQVICKCVRAMAWPCTEHGLCTLLNGVNLSLLKFKLKLKLRQ